MLAAVILLLTGCSQAENKNSRDKEEKLQIVTTIFPPYDFAQKIGGERAEVTMLLKPGMESHSYEPSPADMITIMHSDLFLYAGGESDVWVEELLAANDGNIRAYSLLDWVDPLEEETSEGMQVREHGHAHHEKETDHAVHLEETEYDEHVWTSPQNAMVLTEKICGAMAELDPENADYFAENAASYQEELQKLDETFRDVREKAVRDTLVFGDRFPLLYFVKTYDLDFEAAFPGCSMETEPSAATIAFLTDKVKKEQIPVIFKLEMSNGRIADAIAEATGAEVCVFYSVHGITADDLAAGADYLSLMYRNAEALKKALW